MFLCCAGGGSRVDSTSAYGAGGLLIESRHPTSATYVACRECDQLPCWLPRGQHVSHQRWISGIHCVQVRKHAIEGSTLALKPRGDITISPKQGYQWPHKKDLCPPKIFLKKVSLCFQKGTLKRLAFHVLSDDSSNKLARQSELCVTFSGFRCDTEHWPPDAAPMFQRHGTCLDALRCFLDLFTVLRYLPQITAVCQQMEGQDDSEQVNVGKHFDIQNPWLLITVMLNIEFCVDVGETNRDYQEASRKHLSLFLSGKLIRHTRNVNIYLIAE